MSPSVYAACTGCAVCKGSRLKKMKIWEVEAVNSNSKISLKKFNVEIEFV